MIGRIQNAVEPMDLMERNVKRSSVEVIEGGKIGENRSLDQMSRRSKILGGKVICSKKGRICILEG